MRPGARNLITDVAGILVGNAEAPGGATGVTVLTADRPLVAAVSVAGGAPGTRETDLLAPGRLVERVDALVLSGGSAFGLAAADGVMAALAARGRGFPAPGRRVPIVPAAILYDLAPGGEEWRDNPYPALGARALAAAGIDFALGSAGAGAGATCRGLRGGLGSASAVLSSGHTVGALAAVNALGSPLAGAGPWFWAAPFEMGAEFGGLGPAPAHALDPAAEPPPGKGPGEATTLAIVATDAALDRAGLHRLAVAAQDGIARALVPAHTLFDGDLVFAVSTGASPLADPMADAFALGQAAAAVLARAIARGVHAAAPQRGGGPPAWRDLYG
jgi:D-aminopeptidase